MDTFRAAQATAREAALGLWSADCGDDTDAPGATLSIHTGPGDDTDTAHHAGRTQAIWNNSGRDTAALRDADGTVIDDFTYDS